MPIAGWEPIFEPTIVDPGFEWWQGPESPFWQGPEPELPPSWVGILPGGVGEPTGYVPPGYEPPPTKPSPDPFAREKQFVQKYLIPTWEQLLRTPQWPFGKSLAQMLPFQPPYTPPSAGVPTKEVPKTWTTQVPAWEQFGWEIPSPAPGEYPQEDILAYGASYAAQPLVTIPPEVLGAADTPEGNAIKKQWFEGNIPPENTAIFDITTGKQLSGAELNSLLSTKPLQYVVKAYLLGEGAVAGLQMQLWEAMGMPYEQALRTPFVAHFQAQAQQMAATLAQGLVDLLEGGASGEELADEWQTAKRELTTLFESRGGGVGYKGERVGYRSPGAEAEETLWKALPDEEKQEMLAKMPAAPDILTRGGLPYTPPAEAPTAGVNVEALRNALAPHGIAVLDSSPYLTPISEARLRTLPMDVINMMADYLRSKGVSWGDYMAISASYYGGAEPRMQWTPPRQWG